MKYYIFPLFVSTSIYLYLLRKDSLLSTKETKKYYVFLGLNFIGLFISILDIIINIVPLFSHSFVVAAYMCYWSADSLEKLQDKEKMLDDLIIYFILIIQWIALTLSFAFETTQRQAFLHMNCF